MTPKKTNPPGCLQRNRAEDSLHWLAPTAVNQSPLAALGKWAIRQPVTLQTNVLGLAGLIGVCVLIGYGMRRTA